jgi:hypothetical protein
MKNVCLQIRKKEFDLIKAGIKKTDWRLPSKFNKDRLFCPDPDFDGKLNGDPEITSITFTNGTKPDSKKITVELSARIRMVRFSRDVEIPEDNFKALEGQFAIEIKLGKIIG